jgi:hypothetical protein
MVAITEPVPGFEAYSVSNEGDVFGQRGQLLKPSRMRGGYLKFSPYVNGKHHHMSVHRAVLLAFAGDPPDDKRICACHKDGNPANNRLENLYWGSYEDNWEDRKAHGNGGFGPQNGRAKLTQEKVGELRRLYALGTHTSQELGELFGVSQAQANKVGRGLFWPAAV